jgi:hypothetical protein
MEVQVRFAGGHNIAMKVPPHQYEQTIRFYRDVAGLTPIERLAPVVVFEFGGNQLWIDRVPGLSQAEIWLEFAVADATAAAEQLRAADVVRCDEIEPLPDGFRGFWILNPASIVHLVSQHDEPADRPEQARRGLSGGCLCGAIRYEVEATPSQETLCHCSICRRAAAAPCTAWFTVSRAAFRMVCGSPTRFDSSAKGTRAFCGRCGTQLTFEHADFPDEIDVTTCSLDQPECVSPKDHTYVSSKVPWVKLNDALPAYRQAQES